ncbi:MAG: flavin reductase [Oscillospiraceae bacterium]|nr:flavin reductase [Oscillospiraceae bacterium]
MTITDDIKYLGVNDHSIDLFEGQYAVPNGMSYNSYAIIDEKIAVMDTVDAAFTEQWLDNIRKELGGRSPDYLIIQHMEPDHSANITQLIKAYPDVKVVSSERAFAMMKNYFAQDMVDRRIVVGEGDTLRLGRHTLTFVAAPMVHWPEVIVTYDSHDKVLFSADGFGKFGALDKNEDWADEARRYYIGIVGKYGAQVQELLKKAASLDIKAICPLHGPVLSENLSYYFGLYDTWSSYRAEENGTVIAYTSVYGHTKAAVELLAEKLKAQGERAVVYDLARCDMSTAVSDAFRYSKLVLATTTYNASIFPFMREFISHLTERDYQRRSVAFIENGSWAPQAEELMKGMLNGCKRLKFLKNKVTIHSALSDESIEQINALAEELCGNDSEISGSALMNIGYGLYVVTSNDGKKDNGLIVNTVTQVTNTPDRVAVTLGKESYSHDTIMRTGVMNVNFLEAEAPFSVFERFGFHSGRDTDKFKGIEPLRSENGLAVLPQYINSYISLKVEQYVDLGTHGMFICAVTASEVVSDEETMTYTRYLNDVKPKPDTEGKKGYVCKICGYVYEGDELPEDFICPLCKHGAADFEPIQ